MRSVNMATLFISTPKKGLSSNSKRNLFLFVYFLFFSRFSFAQSNQFSLTGTSMGSQNYLRLSWVNSLPGGSTSYSYTLYQWDESVLKWQTTSTNYDKTIKVLNVYPIAEGNNLKTWMENDNAGLGKIQVTPVFIDDFNANPDGYLKPGGTYQYDVIMFGSYDSNASKDLTPTSAAAVGAFLQTGRGVLFGHDTQYQARPNFASLKDWTNLYVDPANLHNAHWRGSDQVKAINDGYLLKYPHTIAYNSILNIPYTHSTGSFAKGIVWMNFPDPVKGGGYLAPIAVVGGGTNDFYLTTWNNAAMIQTGHSGGAATNDEKKIIANTLWYLAQFTTDTDATIRSALDMAMPTIESAVRNSTDCGKVNITAKDNGSAYRFYVEATNLSNATVKYTSNALNIENATGIAGLYIVETNSPTQGDITGATLIPATDNQQLVYNVVDQSKYIHIQAIDHAGNRSAVKTLEPIPTFSYLETAYCTIGTIAPMRTGPTGGTFTATPSGLSINPTSGEINLATSTPNTYTITYNYNTGCTPAIVVVTVNALPVISIEDVTANEGDNLTFNIKLTGGHCSASNATVSYTTIDGTATAPADYVATSGSLIFTPGETEKTITVEAKNDTYVEGVETLLIRLSSPVNCRFVGEASTLEATGTIRDMTDGMIVVEKIKPESDNASEPLIDGAFRIRFADENVTCIKDIKISYVLKGADNPTDYTVVTNEKLTLTTATIESGQNSVEIPIKITDNYIVQGDRELTIELTGIEP